MHQNCAKYTDTDLQCKRWWKSILKILQLASFQVKIILLSLQFKWFKKETTLNLEIDATLSLSYFYSSQNATSDDYSISMNNLQSF